MKTSPPEAPNTKQLIDLTSCRITNVRKPVADSSVRGREQITKFPTGISKQASLRMDAAFVVPVRAFSSLSHRFGATFSRPSRGYVHTVFARELVTADLQRNSHRS